MVIIMIRTILFFVVERIFCSISYFFYFFPPFIEIVSTEILTYMVYNIFIKK